jgi:hypothetical protein
VKVSVVVALTATLGVADSTFGGVPQTGYVVGTVAAVVELAKETVWVGSESEVIVVPSAAVIGIRVVADV